MTEKEILNFIEDKNITQDENWYFHATKNDLETIKKILNEGIKSAYLLNKKGNHFNGKYYISLYKNNNTSRGLNLKFIESPKFIISDIYPYYADRKKYNFRQLFINTRIPLRTSEWDGEFQQYLNIEQDKIIALEYSLSYILSNSENSDIKEKLLFLKEIILYMEQINKNIPIYDLTLNCEINKQKILNLNL